MSQENVEVARRIFDAFARRDVEEVVRLHHRDAVVAFLIAPMLGVEEIRGQDGLRRLLTRELFEGFDAFTAEPMA